MRFHDQNDKRIRNQLNFGAIFNPGFFNTF